MPALSPEHVLFGKNIKTIRITSGMTQEKLADKIGIDRSYEAFLERGEKNPTLSVMVKVAEALTVSLADLFTP